MINPATEFTSQLAAAEAEFDAWIANLKALGWQEDALAEVEGKRTDYMRKLASQISGEFEAFLHPVSDFEKQMDAAAAQFDDWIANLKRLGYAEEEIMELEARRVDHLAQLAAKLERSTAQDLTSRITALQYGQNSFQSTIQSLLFSQRNELDSLKNQFGTGHYLYQTAVGVQGAEMVSTILDQLKAERDKLLEQEQQAQREQISQEQTLLQERTGALQAEINAASNLANTFRRLVRTLEEYRQNLWSGSNNLTGTRYIEAYSQFNSLYEKALAGDEEAFSQITGKADELLSLGREQLPERGEYNDLFYDVDQKLKLVQLAGKQQITVADAQQNILNRQLEALKGQQATLSAQLDAINGTTAAVEAVDYSIDDLNAAIMAMEALLAAQLQALSAKQDNRQSLLEAQAAYANSIGYGGRTDWNAETTLQEIMAGFGSFEKWYDLYGKDQGGLVVPYDTNQARLNIVANKVDQLNAQKYQGRADWTAADFYTAIGGNTAENIDNWYKNWGMAEGITSIREGAESNTQAMIEAMLKGDASLMQQDKAGSKLINAAIGDLNSLNADYWPKILSGMGGIGGGLDASIAGVSTAISGMGSSFSGQMESLLASITKLADASGTTAATGAGASTGAASGMTSSATSASKPAASQNLAALDQIQAIQNDSKYSRQEKEAYAAMGAAIQRQGSTLDNAVMKKWREVNAANTGGKSDWTIAEVERMIINANGSVENWYNTKGKAQGYASGGITPANAPFWVGEKGPELMMSPRSWGVVSHEASEALMEKRRYPCNAMLPAMPQLPAREAGGVDRAEMDALLGYIRQLVGKLDKTAYESQKQKEILDKWDRDGLPGARDDDATAGAGMPIWPEPEGAPA